MKETPSTPRNLNAGLTYGGEFLPKGATVPNTLVEKIKAQNASFKILKEECGKLDLSFRAREILF
jgi:UDP-glucose 6-dehydrogenase